jgi:hypothetical protein
MSNVIGLGVKNVVILYVCLDSLMESLFILNRFYFYLFFFAHFMLIFF